MKQRAKPRKVRNVIDRAAFSEIPFVIFGIGLIFAFMGLYVPYFYLQAWALQEGIVTGGMNFYLLAILNSGSLVGRTVS